MQISKKILLHLFIICILVLVNLCTVNEMVTKEEILDSNFRKINVVENVVQSASYGLGLGKNRSPLWEKSYDAVEHKESQVKGRNTSALMVTMKEEWEELIDSPSRIQKQSIAVGFARGYTDFKTFNFCGHEFIGLGLFKKREEANITGLELPRMIHFEKIKEEESAWTFVKPFTPGMWWTTAAIMIYTSLVVCLVEQNINPLIYREMSTTEAFLIIWSAVSTVSLSQNVRIESRSARIVIAVWLLVMFIIVSSYADNFNSRINAQEGSPMETPKRLGVKDFLGLFIITLMVSTMTLLIFLFNLLHGSGAAGQETDRQLEMLPPNDDSEEQSSVQGETVQTMLGTSNVSEAEENTLVEASSISILHTANEFPSIEDQNV